MLTTPAMRYLEGDQLDVYFTFICIIGGDTNGRASQYEGDIPIEAKTLDDRWELFERLASRPRNLHSRTLTKFLKPLEAKCMCCMNMKIQMR